MPCVGAQWPLDGGGNRVVTDSFVGARPLSDDGVMSLASGRVPVVLTCFPLCPYQTTTPGASLLGLGDNFADRCTRH